MEALLESGPWQGSAASPAQGSATVLGRLALTGTSTMTVNFTTLRAVYRAQMLPFSPTSQYLPPHTVILKTGIKIRF